jgi:hypothetical protein
MTPYNGPHAIHSPARAALVRALSRRSVLRQLGLAGVSLLAASAFTPALADERVTLPLPSDPRERPVTRDFPQKGSMILQRTRPPLLETPMEVFDRGAQRPVLCTLALGRHPTKADAINNNCLACHSADMVLNQPALPRTTWEAEVHKMIKAYGAPVDDADVPAIVDYLASTKGTK